MVGLPCLLSQCAKLHVAGWKCAVFTRVYLESCTWPVAIFTMDQRKEERVCIKFCANRGERSTETLTIIQQAFEDQSLSRAQVFQWHARFKTGRTSVDYDEHTGRHTNCTTPETVARIQELVRQDRRRTIHDISEEVGIGCGACQRVLTEEFGMHRVAVKFVPRILTADEKQQRVNVCTELRQLVSNDETFLFRIITGDESWVYGNDPETKQQSSQWKSPMSPRPKRPDRWKAMSRAWLSLSLTSRGLCTKNVPTGQTMNSGFYCEFLGRLRENVQRHRPQIWREQTWLLYHDNFPSHTSVLTQQFLTKTKWLSSPTHRTPLIWHPVTSSYFQIWNWSWKDAGLIPLRRYRPNRRECLTLWWKITSRKRSKNGGDGGTGVSMRERSTSRVTVANRPYGEFNDFYSVNPETFGYHLVFRSCAPYLKAVPPSAT